MRIPDYHETLVRFGLQALVGKNDLFVGPDGDLAVTRDGDLQLGDGRHSAMFRFIDLWRYSQPTVEGLFAEMAGATARQTELQALREGGLQSLRLQPQSFHSQTDAIVASKIAAASVAGSIAVILYNLLMRLKLDLSATDADWKRTAPILAGCSVGQIMEAAAANFRHYDEWACAVTATPQQLKSMQTLCAVLNLPVAAANGMPTVRENVCDQVLMRLSQGSIDTLHASLFEFAKALAKF